MPQFDERAHSPGDSPSSDAALPSLRHAESFPWLLLLILVVGLALRLLYVTAPLVDAHRWRQVDTAAIARVFYEERFNILRPEAIWGGPDGAVESEFPLLPALAAITYKAFGPSEALGRVVRTYCASCLARQALAALGEST